MAHRRWGRSRGVGRFNPREFKRFINTYTLQRKVSPHLEPTVMLALQAINFRLDWLTVRSSLLAYRDAFMQALNQYTQDHLRASRCRA